VLLVISLSGSAIAEKLSNYFFKTYTSYCYHRTRNSRAPRLIDLGLIQVLNETADNANRTMVDDNRREIAIGIEPWAHLCGDFVEFHSPRFQPGESH
jgi:hypothetical protein